MMNSNSNIPPHPSSNRGSNSLPFPLPSRSFHRHLRHHSSMESNLSVSDFGGKFEGLDDDDESESEMSFSRSTSLFRNNSLAGDYTSMLDSTLVTPQQSERTLSTVDEQQHLQQQQQQDNTTLNASFNNLLTINTTLLTPPLLPHDGMPRAQSLPLTYDEPSSPPLLHTLHSAVVASSNNNMQEALPVDEILRAPAPSRNPSLVRQNGYYEARTSRSMSATRLTT